MKANLEFNLPEDQEEFDMCLKAGAVMSALSEFDGHLRSITKYAEDSLPEPQLKEREEIRAAFYRLLGEYI